MGIEGEKMRKAQRNLLEKESEKQLVILREAKKKAERYEKPEEIARKRRDNVKSEVEGNQRKISYKIERRKERDMRKNTKKQQRN